MGSDPCLLLTVHWTEPVTCGLLLTRKEWREIWMNGVTEEARVDRGAKKVMEKRRSQKKRQRRNVQGGRRRTRRWYPGTQGGKYYKEEGVTQIGQ